MPKKFSIRFPKFTAVTISKLLGIKMSNYVKHYIMPKRGHWLAHHYIPVRECHYLRQISYGRIHGDRKIIHIKSLLIVCASQYRALN